MGGPSTQNLPEVEETVAEDKVGEKIVSKAEENTLDKAVESDDLSEKEAAE